MNQPSSFDTLAEALVPDDTQAMILIEETAQNEGWMLLERLRLLVGNESSFKALTHEPPLIFLIHLSADRLHEAVLRLTEQGVTRLKAVQPVDHGGYPSLKSKIGRN